MGTTTRWLSSLGVAAHWTSLLQKAPPRGCDLKNKHLIGETVRAKLLDLEIRGDPEGLQ